MKKEVFIGLALLLLYFLARQRKQSILQALTPGSVKNDVTTSPAMTTGSIQLTQPATNGNTVVIAGGNSGDNFYVDGPDYLTGGQIQL